MKKNNVLEYRLADFGQNSPIIRVQLRQTSWGYWSFRMQPNSHLDMVDRLFSQLVLAAGLGEKISELLNKVKSNRHRLSCVFLSALYSFGEHFPSRESIEKLIANGYMPCWKQAIEKIMEKHVAGDNWLDVVMKAELPWPTAGQGTGNRWTTSVLRNN